ncbi:MAG TPA: flagellar hook protein FlgE [Candidatus Desulfovibrio intestinigallinarum]|nr:flagellar hook protein FlgE [Candidatus Desulfovibrio intestinigallinarum]
MSGLSASMWTGVSGLQTHSKNMNVIGNNLANVSTLGFKSQRMDFNDYLYLSGSSASGPTQIGAGSSVYAVLGDFSQGALEATNSATDIAIDGNGYFGVRKPNSDQIFYTRAGDFYFNADRELVNPQGMRLQGWRVDNTTRLTFKQGGVTLGDESNVDESVFVGTGSPTDIILDSWNIVPQRTTSVKFTMGLTDNGTGDKTVGAARGSNFTALFDTWDGTAQPPLAESAYATQSSITTYDESGNEHELTVYYDQVTVKNDDPNNPIMTNVPAGYKVYEYLVTMNPEEDMRTAPDNKTTFAGTKDAGKLMTGVLIFDSAGNLVNQTAYTYNGNEAPSTNGVMSDRAWSPTKFSSNGLPVFAVNWTGQDNASTVWQANAEDQIIELNLGAKATGNWHIADIDPDTGGTTPVDVDPNTGDGTTPPNETLDDVTNDYNSLALMVGPEIMAGASACNQNKSSLVQDRSQNGYASGILSSYNIDENGVIYGIYDNGVSLPLYQITMYDFHNYQGLRREGGNLYSATSDSGEPRIGAAGDNGFGETMAYNIENSNVDMTTELVRMITCQRGFQSNSKIITTVDTMLETVIGMKR